MSTTCINNNMKLRYRYRIYPTPDQEQAMTSVGGSVRFLYNHFLKVNIDQYQLDKKFVWHFDMCQRLVELKKELPWLSETYSQVLQQSLKDLDSALKNMKKTGAGFPQFKSKYTNPFPFDISNIRQSVQMVSMSNYPKLAKYVFGCIGYCPAIIPVALSPKQQGVGMRALSLSNQNVLW